jgi:phage terminase small subunit
MNIKHNTFISEYLKTGNATAAAIFAGYSKNTAYSQGQRLLKKVEIMNELKIHKTAAIREAEVSLTAIIKEIRQISLNGKNDYIRLKAYDMLMQHLGGYEYKVTSNVFTNLPIEIKVINSGIPLANSEADIIE